MTASILCWKLISHITTKFMNCEVKNPIFVHYKLQFGLIENESFVSPLPFTFNSENLTEYYFFIPKLRMYKYLCMLLNDFVRFDFKYDTGPVQPPIFISSFSFPHNVSHVFCHLRLSLGDFKIRKWEKYMGFRNEEMKNEEKILVVLTPVSCNEVCNYAFNYPFNIKHMFLKSNQSSSDTLFLTQCFPFPFNLPSSWTRSHTKYLYHKSTAQRHRVSFRTFFSFT